MTKRVDGRTWGRRCSSSVTKSRKAPVRRRWLTAEGLEDRTLLAAAPSVTTLAASALTGPGATLNGTVNPNGGSTDTFFQFSTDPNLSASVLTTLAGGSQGSSDGTGSQAQFYIPKGVAVDGAGNVYVADTFNDTIREITPAGVVTTLAGTPGKAGSTDGTGSAALFDWPTGVAVDVEGNVYVADDLNSTIRKITPAGVVTTLAGSAGTYGSKDGTGGQAQFSGPTGVAVDLQGDVYVADQGNDTIREITPAGVVTTLAGTPGKTGSTDGTGSAALFNGPAGVAVDPQGNVYVADTSNDTIRKITPARVVSTLAGVSGTLGHNDGPANAAEFWWPRGVAADAMGNVYVADTYNGLIREVTSAGVVTTVSGQSGQFASDYSVAVDPEGNVYGLNGDAIVKLAIPVVPAQSSLTGTTAQPVSASLTGLALNTTYYYRVVATNATGTTEGPILSFITPAQTVAPPVVATLPASAITTNGATLNATVNPEGNSTTYDFVYGTDPNLATGATSTTVSAAGSGTSAVAESVPLSGLMPNTKYYFQVVATNAAGTVAGSIFSFSTPAPASPPAATTQAASAITSSGATLNATVNPEGNTTSYNFVFGTDPTLTSGTSTTAVTAIGSETSDLAEATPLSGLTPNTKYYFEVVATNAGGTTHGAIVSFTTTTPALPPTVTTQAASAITSTGATLNGSVNPNGSSTDTFFQYSTDPALSPNVVTTLAGGTEGSNDGSGVAAQFHGPEGLAVDSAGNVYVADTLNEIIRKITPTGVVTTLAGSPGQAGSADGTGGAARFFNPSDVAVDLQGDVYVADDSNNTIRKITPAGVVTTLAGSPGHAGSADGIGSAASFDEPSAVAVDFQGNVYVADFGNDAIRKITPAGVVTTLAGSPGQAGSADGTGNMARFDSPSGVAVDSAGNVYVADVRNDTVRKVTPAGVVTTLAGSVGQTGSADGPGSSAEFNSPFGVSVDDAGNVYVTDTLNSTLRRITPAGVVTTLAGMPGQNGFVDGIGGDARLNFPAGVAVDAQGSVYVGDTPDNAIRKLSIPSVSAQTSMTGTSAQAVNSPLSNLAANTNYYYRAVATSAGGTTDGAILSFTTQALPPTATTQAASAITSNGATLNATVNPEGTSTTYDFIYGTDPTLNTGITSTTLAALGSGTSDVGITAPITGLTANTRYYFQVVATNTGGTTEGAILAFTTTSAAPPPTATTQAASTITSDGATLNATINPEGVSTSYDFVFGTDPALTTGITSTTATAIGAGVSDVHVTAPLSGLTPNTKYYFEVVATSTAGTTNGSILNFATSVAPPSATTLAASAIATTNATLNGNVNPNGGSTDTFFQYSTDPTLPANVVSTLAGGTQGSSDGTGSAAQFYLPGGVAVDRAGNVYVADTIDSTIRKIAPGGVVTTLAGSTGMTGSTDGTGNNAAFKLPFGIATDGAGNVYVADTGNNTIRKITPDGVVSTLAGTAGQSGSTDGAGTTTALFDGPFGVAVDLQGNIYVADIDNSTIRKITPDGVVSTLAGSAGQTGSTDGAATSAALFNAPTGVAVDSQGNVYVADSRNDTIRKITPDGVVTTLAGSAGHAGTQDGLGSAAEFNNPSGVAVDDAGNVYVADQNNSTIRKVTPDGLVTTLAGTPGNPGFVDETGSKAQFDFPFGVAVDSQGNVYVADTESNAIRTLSIPSVPAQTGLVGTSAQAVSASLPGLNPNTSYAFRVVATNAGGTTTGSIVSFTTSPAAVGPTATTLPATNVTSTGATLHGTVNPEGNITNVVFLYGTDPTLTTGTATIGAGNLGAGASEVSVSDPVTILSPDTTYYYRVVATYPGGTVDGAIMSFHTGAPASIQFGEPVLVVNVTAGTATLSLTRAGNLSQSIGAVVSSPGNATFPPFHQTVSFPPTVTTATVSIPIPNDGHPGEPDVGIPFTLSAPSAGAAVGTTATAWLVVHDNNFLPPPVTITLTTPSIRVQVGRGRKPKFKNELVIQLNLSGPLNGAGNAGAYHLFSGKTKKGATTFNTVVPLSSVLYNATAHTVTLTPLRPLNLSQPKQLQVTSALLTDGLGRPFNAGQTFAITFSKRGITAAQVRHP